MFKIPALKVQIAAHRAVKHVKTKVDDKLNSLKEREQDLELVLKNLKAS